MPNLIYLIYNFDIFQQILQEWIELGDIIQLDTALTNHELRNYLFPLMRKIPYTLSCSRWTIEKSLQWFIKRNMYNLMNEIDVNPMTWHRLLYDSPNINKLSFLHNIKQLTIRYRNNSQSYLELNECIAIKELKMYFIGNSLKLPPNITTIYLHQCTMNQELIQSFENCEKLISFHCEGTVFLPIDHKREYLFFHCIKCLIIDGKCFSFLKHWLFNKNSFHQLILDNYFGAQKVDNPFPILFHYSYQLQRLEMNKFSWICLYDLFYAINECRHESFYSLTLNNVGIDDNQPLTEEEEDSLVWSPITDLTLIRLLYLREPWQLEMILKLTKRQLKRLRIVQFLPFSITAYEMILFYCPLLEELVIETSALTDQSYDYLCELFQSIPSVTIKGTGIT